MRRKTFNSKITQQIHDMIHDWQSHIREARSVDPNYLYRRTPGLMPCGYA